MTCPGKQTVSSEEVEALARRLSDTCPWSRSALVAQLPNPPRTIRATVLNHHGWVDVVEHIRWRSEEAFQLLKQQVEG